MGCQQSVSSSRLDGNETQNRSERVMFSPVMGQLVDRFKPPHGGPGLFRATRSLLRNIPNTDGMAHAAVSLLETSHVQDH